MSGTPFETTRGGTKIGYVYSSTPHMFRGLAQRGISAICKHDHRTEQAAMRCARRSAREAGWQ